MSDLPRPKKVLHVLNSACGGAALSTIGLIEHLRTAGIEACAVCHNAGTPAERAMLAEAVRGRILFTDLYWWNRKIRAAAWKRPLLELRQILKTGWTWRSTAKLAEFASSAGADLIHTNTILTPEGGLAARQLGLPHVWHLRELVGPGNPFRLRLEGPAFGEYLARHCTKLIANSYISAAQVRAWLPEGMLEVVPNGIDISRFVGQTAAAARRPLVVGMVGSLTSRSKKHQLFVDAAAKVDRSLDIEWRIYGHDPSSAVGQQDPYVAELRRQIAAAGLQESMVWPGFVADPAQIMSELDILVHPADNESFGRVVVEAMAAGLPVVGVRGGGVGEIVADEVTGLLAGPDDADALARRIERLVRNPQIRHEMGDAGRQRALDHYSLDACARGVLQVYRQAMALAAGTPQPAAPTSGARPPQIVNAQQS